MGGDGGVVATSRRYLRGAGKGESKGETKDKSATDHEQIKTFNHCSLSDELFTEGMDIVACPLGRLYVREKALEALLDRKSQGGSVSAIGKHVRGMKDLFSVRFQWNNQKPSCPVTGRELNGLIRSYALVPGKPGQVNTLSQYGINQLEEKDLELEYGPIQEKLLLSPSVEELKEVKDKLSAKRANEKAEKKKVNGSKKKRRREDDKVADISTIKKSALPEAARTSKAVSSLFNKESTLSQKEKKDGLFAR